MATIPRTYPAAVERSAVGLDLLRWVTTVDHKDIGILYLLTANLFLLIGGFEAMLMRTQLIAPRLQVLPPGAYNALFTMHGTTMIFLAVMPMFIGLANYLVPLMIGARDMAFPKLNALSFWLTPLGGLVLYYSFLVGSPPDTGWFSYAPLTEHPYQLQSGIDYWALGLLLASVGSIMTGINLIVTVATLRAPGMSAFRIPVFVWMSVLMAGLMIWAIPSLTAAQVMLLLDRYVGTHFFDAAAGADVLLWQHLFWFFGHPEVYILILPGFGIISEVIPVFSRRPLFGYGFIILSGFFIAFYSFLTWGHHMFATGLGLLQEAFYSGSTLLISVPTGVKIFSWIATMWGGRIRLTTSILFAIGFIATFTIGGLTGVHFALVPIDWQTTETYYVVAHLHYVLIGGSLNTIFAGLYYWLPKMTGRKLDERLGTWHFWLTMLGFNLAFFPQHFLGLMGMARRMYTYPDLPGWGAVNALSSVGAYILGAATLLFWWNVYRSIWRGRGQLAGDNPWDGWTLEWATSSPPPAHNFSVVPAITSPRPLWDLRHALRGSDAGPSAGAGQEPIHLEAPTPVARVGGFFERMSTTVLGMSAFISSESVFFGALVVSYLAYRTRSASGPGPGDLDVGRTALFSLALFASSASMVLAERSLHRDQIGRFVVWVLTTLGLGVVFLAGQVTEYMRLYQDGITAGANLFTSAFFTLTGFHGLHVLVGLVLLAILAAMARAGDLRAGRNRSAAQAISLYWHFVDGVWVVVFSVVYLWALAAR
jgi:cytochrome c oxidase subunit I